MQEDRHNHILIALPSHRGVTQGMRNEICLSREVALEYSSLHSGFLPQAKRLSYFRQANDVAELAGEGVSHDTAHLLSARYASRGIFERVERGTGAFIEAASAL